MVKGLILDIDETIYSHEKAQQHAFSKFYPFAAKRLGINEQTFIEAFQRGNKKNKNTLHNCAATHHRGIYIKYALEELQINPFPHVAELYDYFWQSFIEGVEIYPGVIDVLEELKRHDVKIGFCTDMTLINQYRKIEKLGIGHLVGCMVSSEELNCEKPTPAIYQAVLERLHLAPEEVLMAGDNLKRDVLGAEAMGMKAAWYMLDGANEKDYNGNKYNNYTDGKFLSFLE